MQKVLIGNRTYNAAAHVVAYYEKQLDALRAQLAVSQAAQAEQINRANAKFTAFAALVFSPVVNTTKPGETCKEIHFENGAAIRYNPKTPGESMRFFKK